MTPYRLARKPRWQRPASILTLCIGLAWGLAAAPEAGAQALALPGVQVSNPVGIINSGDAVLTVNPPPNNFGAALNPALQWSTGGNGNWTSEARVIHDGATAAQSGRITDNQISRLRRVSVGKSVADKNGRRVLLRIQIFHHARLARRAAVLTIFGEIWKSRLPFTVLKFEMT